MTFTRVPWPATEADAGRAMALYHPAEDRFLQLNWNGDTDLRQLDGLSWRDLESWLADQECRYLGSGPDATAALLLRHGFLVPSRRQARPPAARLRAEIGTGTQSHEAVQYVSNPVTGVTIRLRGTAVDTWQNWQDGVTPSSTDDAVTEQLVRYGFLYREPVGAWQTQPGYLTQGQAV